VLKDRLYTTAPKSLARRSAQTALWQITHAMLRWMAPFLSFTAEEAWPIVAGAKNQGSIFFETFWKFTTPDEALLAKWGRIRAIRELANKEIEALRAAGQVGASLQATLTITAGADDAALLRSLGEDLKFVTITSAATVVDGPSWPSRWRPAAPSSASAAGTTATTWAATRPTPRCAAAAAATSTARAKPAPWPERGRHGSQQQRAQQVFRRQHQPVGLAGPGRGGHPAGPVQQDADPGLLPAGRQPHRHLVLQRGAGAQPWRSLLLPGRGLGLAALVLHRPGRRGLGFHRLDAAPPPRPDPVLLRGQHDPGRRWAM
jgi:hypothetical protein